MCETCFKRIEQKEVQTNDYIEDAALEEAREVLGNRNRVYTKVYAGQGCIWYVKRVNDQLRVFFMHGDSWGQYGENTSDVPRMEAFLQGMTEIENRY
jgi:hypothetical protein